MTHRPGPLQELPLDRFLPPDSNVNTTPTKPTLRSNKRPLSPGTPALYSPVKRRVLNEEGIFTPAVKLKSPLSSSASGRLSSSHFHEFMHGPDSPVRKLDFGPVKAGLVSPILAGSDVVPMLPRNASLDATPRRRTPSSFSHPTPTPPKATVSVRTTPKSHLASSSSLGSLPEVVDDCFSPQSHRTSHLTSSTSVPLLVPRVPIHSGPRSIHYPGFYVFLDTHDYLPTDQLIPMVGAQSDNSSDRGTEKPVKLKEVEKENIAPRSRPPRFKSNAAPAAFLQTAWSKGVPLFSDEKRKDIEGSGSAVSTAATPRSKETYKMSRDIGLTSLSAPRFIQLASSPSSTLTDVTPGRLSIGRQERIERRKVPEDEVDAVDAEDEP